MVLFGPKVPAFLPASEQSRVSCRISMSHGALSFSCQLPPPSLHPGSSGCTLSHTGSAHLQHKARHSEF